MDFRNIDYLSLAFELLLISFLPLPDDPYKAIRQAYLVRTNTKSGPFKGEARTPESPHIVAPPTCHDEESEGSGTSGAKSTSSDSTAPLSPDHPLTHTTPVLVPILHRTACMAVRVLSMMSPGLSAGIAEVAAMSDLAFRKSEEDEEVEESLDFGSESENAKDDGPTTEDEDPAAEDEGLAAGVEGPSMDDESYGLDDEHHGVDDESRGIDDEGRGQGSGSAPKPGRSKKVSAFRQPTLTTWTDSKDGMLYIDVPVYPRLAPPVQTPPSLE
nr:hypothetical protein [Tanacetum cinerariifolium]